MSRTIRRKSATLPCWITTDWVRDEDGCWKRVDREGVVLAQWVAKFHGDHGWGGYTGYNRPPKWFRKDEQQKYRAKAQTEIHKFFKDEDYEVQIQDNPYLPYWD